MPSDSCLPCKSAIAVLIASSANTLQCILTGGKASSSAMSVFLISVAIEKGCNHANTLYFCLGQYFQIS